jgi:hypothetical protein
MPLPSSSTPAGLRILSAAKLRPFCSTRNTQLRGVSATGVDLVSDQRIMARLSAVSTGD